jgi:hypothetical protein
MKIGDLVFANYDEQRGIMCIGLVLEMRKERVTEETQVLRSEAKIMWSSRYSPIGWWLTDQLRVISESR